VKVLLKADEIGVAVARLGGQIQADYQGRPLTVLGVMTGSVMFLADLMRQLTLPVRVGVVQARSYRGDTAPGPLAINADFLPHIEGRDILVVDDIFDTGQTLFELADQLDQFKPKSVRSAVLLSKQGRARVSLRPDYVGFEIPDAFVVGYGLDFRDAYRHLPHVAVLEEGDFDVG
jgi:hypoxanthine phosphoribosyltransferase